MLPLFAALHAGSACLLLKILSFFKGNTSRWVRVTAVVPFLAFPSAALFYAQLLKDSYFIFGNLLFIYVWLSWLEKRKSEKPVFLPEYIFNFFLLALAYLMVWIIRPYWGPVFFFWSLVFFILITIGQIRLLFFNGRPWKKTGGYWIWSLVLVVAFFLAVQQKSLPRTMITEVPGHEQLRVELPWKHSQWLPAYLDSRLQSMAISRKAFTVKYSEAGTNIDTDIMFYDPGDMILYLPRAFRVGFFMPTLSMTFGKGLNPGGDLMRRVTGLEMVFLYLCYPFLFLAGWFYRKRLEFWVFIIWAFGGHIAFHAGFPQCRSALSIPLWFYYVPDGLGHPEGGFGLPRG